MHEGTKLVAAVGVTLEHVERRSARRKEDHFAGLGDGVRALDRVGERVRDLARHRALPIAANPARHFANQNDGARFFGDEIA